MRSGTPLDPTRSWWVAASAALARAAGAEPAKLGEPRCSGPPEAIRREILDVPGELHRCLQRVGGGRALGDSRSRLAFQAWWPASADVAQDLADGHGAGLDPMVLTQVLDELGQAPRGERATGLLRWGAVSLLFTDGSSVRFAQAVAKRLE